MRQPSLLALVAFSFAACVEPLEPPADDSPTGAGARSSARSGSDAATSSPGDAGSGDARTNQAQASGDDAPVSAPGGAAAQPPVLQITPPRDATAFKELALGEIHSCALRNNGQVLCWGHNGSGQLGAPTPYGSSWDRSEAQPVAGLDDVVTIYAGGDATCAKQRDGTISCWGAEYVTLPDGSGGSSSIFATMVPEPIEPTSYGVEQRTAPLPIEDMTEIVQMSLGNSFHCARRANGEVRCWGLNYRGQLGDGTRTGRGRAESARSSRSVVMRDATQIASGEQHTCGLDSAGRIWCWGSDLLGTTWDPMTTDLLSPEEIVVEDVAKVEVGLTHGCALQRSGQVRCWGGNARGQLGDGTNQGSSTPVLVKDLNDAVDIALGNNEVCALKASGHVACWGENYQGILGTGDAEFRPTPALVVELDDAYAISEGGGHTCALSLSRGLLCWGNNGNMQVGDGTSEQRDRPVPVNIVD